MADIDVLVVGAGPVGLTAAAELRRHGVGCRIIDHLPTPPQYAKAVGVQPRTLEVWEDMGLLGRVLDEAIELRGQIVTVNGREVARVELALPPEVPYRFLGLPQYATERLIAEHLAGFGTEVERGVELRSFEQDEAHSVARKGLGLDFTGDAFPEEYMLGDVEVDWALPRGMVLRAMHQMDGTTDDLLVCIPLPGRNRYRMSTFVSDDLATAPGAGAEHGLMTDAPGPTLRHIQAVLDRLAPEPTTASNLRWSSVFRISHRLVERYGLGRVFLAGDAAHIHPPTGAQGMNTGIQDASNLAWKLALAVSGAAAEGLIESYHAERHPVGEEVVGRTVRAARAGAGEEPDDVATAILREAQLLVGYPDSPLVGEDVAAGAPVGGPAPGMRAPDAPGLAREGVTAEVRLFELLRGPEHVLLLWPGGHEAVEVERVAAAARSRAHGRLRAYAVLPADAPDGSAALPTVRDARGGFSAAYGAGGPFAYLIRPAGYVGYRQAPIDGAALVAYLGRTFAASAPARPAGPRTAGALRA